MSDLYKPPAFLFYVDDFVGGTIDLTTEQIGIYILLLSYQWGRGTIPMDTPAMARIARTTPSKMKDAWKALQRCFAPSPEAGGLQNPRLEAVREKMRLNAETNRQRGKAGAARRWKTEPETDAQALVEHCSTFKQPLLEECGKNDTPLSIVRSPSIPPVVPPGEFARWFYDAAVVSELLQPVIDPNLWVHRSLGDAQELLLIYGLEQCQARALAFIRAIQTKKIHRAATLRYLRECWDYREIHAELARVVVPAKESSVVARLRAAQEGGA